MATVPGRETVLTVLWTFARSSNEKYAFDILYRSSNAEVT